MLRAVRNHHGDTEDTEQATETMILATDRTRMKPSPAIGRNRIRNRILETNDTRFAGKDLGTLIRTNLR